MWNLTGQHVTGIWHGQLVRGRVEESRVKYGGLVQHIVLLDVPIVYMAEVRHRVLLAPEQIRGQ